MSGLLRKHYSLANTMKFYGSAIGIFVAVTSLTTPSLGFTITGNAVPGISTSTDVATSVSENFAAAGLTLTGQSRIENNVGFLSFNGNDVLSYTANQALLEFPNTIHDFDAINDFVPASSTVTNLTNDVLNVWIGDLDGNPISGNANTYDFVSSTGQTLLSQRFLDGESNPAIEVSLLPSEVLTITTVASDNNPFKLGDDGRYVAIAERVSTSTPEPSTLLGLGTLALAGGTLLRRKRKA